MEKLAEVWGSHHLSPCCKPKMKPCLVLLVDSEEPHVNPGLPKLDSVLYPQPRVAREEQCLSWTTATAIMAAGTTCCHLTNHSFASCLSYLKIAFSCKISPSTISTAHRPDPLLLLTA